MHKSFCQRNLVAFSLKQKAKIHQLVRRLRTAVLQDKCKRKEITVEEVPKQREAKEKNTILWNTTDGGKPFRAKSECRVVTYVGM